MEKEFCICGSGLELPFPPRCTQCALGMCLSCASENLLCETCLLRQYETMKVCEQCQYMTENLSECSKCYIKLCPICGPTCNTCLIQIECPGCKTMRTKEQLDTICFYCRTRMCCNHSHGVCLRCNYKFNPNGICAKCFATPGLMINLKHVCFLPYCDKTAPCFCYQFDKRFYCKKHTNTCSLCQKLFCPDAHGKGGEYYITLHSPDRVCPSCYWTFREFVICIRLICKKKGIPKDVVKILALLSLKILKE